MDRVEREYRIWWRVSAIAVIWCWLVSMFLLCLGGAAAFDGNEKTADVLKIAAIALLLVPTVLHTLCQLFLNNKVATICYRVFTVAVVTLHVGFVAFATIVDIFKG